MQTGRCAAQLTAVFVLGIASVGAFANTTAPCVPPGSTLLTGEVVGYGPANFVGNRAASLPVSPADGSTWARNPYYTSGTSAQSQYAKAGFRFTDVAGHNCSGYTYTISRFDGRPEGPWGIAPRAGGTFLLAGTSVNGGAGSFVAGTATCKIDCSTCPCTCDQMSYTLT